MVHGEGVGLICRKKAQNAQNKDWGVSLNHERRVEWRSDGVMEWMLMVKVVKLQNDGLTGFDRFDRMDWFGRIRPWQAVLEGAVDSPADGLRQRSELAIFCHVEQPAGAKGVEPRISRISRIKKTFQRKVAKPQSRQGGENFLRLRAFAALR